MAAGRARVWSGRQELQGTSTTCHSLMAGGGISSVLPVGSDVSYRVTTGVVEGCSHTSLSCLWSKQRVVHSSVCKLHPWSLWKHITSWLVTRVTKVDVVRTGTLVPTSINAASSQLHTKRGAVPWLMYIWVRAAWEHTFRAPREACSQQ